MNPRPAEGTTPWEAMQDRLASVAEAAESRGDPELAEQLRGLAREWWNEQRAWNDRLSFALGAHHEINNALVGIRGNAQLLLMNPAMQQSGIRERLEVVLRESGRIQEAAGRLRELKASHRVPAPDSRAA